MAESPFAFFRGAAAIMAMDLSTTPVTGLTVQACGDAHVANFGTFATPERNVIFDINDFDETDRGPWEWDVKRLAASLHVVARQHGFAPDDRDDVVLEAVRVYREYVARYAAMMTLEVCTSMPPATTWKRSRRWSTTTGRPSPTSVGSSSIATGSSTSPAGLPGWAAQAASDIFLGGARRRGAASVLGASTPGREGPG